MKRLIDHVGITGVAALVLLAAAVAFSSFVLRPLEARGALMQERLSRKAPAATEGELRGASKVAAVYEYLKKPEETTDWLAKLHGIGTATGVQLRSATYRSQPSEGRIERYEIVLPATGSYGQIRDFLKRARAEIPVMSVDQVKLAKDGANRGLVQAEMRLTLHMVKS
ncbi:MAG TPA: GspMb/PilO family protein [Burkholderiales bacterium]|nr:GspMb/PilO family protein [Burkholderiales bacterium]